MSSRALELQAWIDAEGYKRRSMVRVLEKKQYSTRLSVQIEIPPTDYVVEDFHTYDRGDQVMQATASDGLSEWQAWATADGVDHRVFQDDNGRYWMRLHDQADGQNAPRLYFAESKTWNSTDDFFDITWRRFSGGNTRPYFGLERSGNIGIVLFYMSTTLLQVFSNSGVRTVISTLVAETAYRLRIRYASDTTATFTIWNDDTGELIYGPTEWNNRDDAGTIRKWSDGAIIGFYSATGGGGVYNNTLFTDFSCSWLPRTTTEQLTQFLTALRTRCWRPDVDSFRNVANGATMIGETTALGTWSGYGTPGTCLKVIDGTDHYWHLYDNQTGAGWGAVLTFNTPRDPADGGVIDFDVYIVQPTMFGYFILGNADASRGMTAYYHTTGGVLAYAGAGGAKFTSTEFPTEEWVHFRFEFLTDSTFKVWINSIPCVEVGGTTTFTSGTPFNGSENAARFRWYSDTGSVQQYYVKNIKCSWMPVGNQPVAISHPSAKYLGKHPVSKRLNWDVEVEVHESW